MRSWSVSSGLLNFASAIKNPSIFRFLAVLSVSIPHFEWIFAVFLYFFVLLVKLVGQDCKIERSNSIRGNEDKTQKLWKPLLTQFSLSEASRNGLHNGIERDDFPTTTSQPTRTKISSNSS